MDRFLLFLHVIGAVWFTGSLVLSLFFKWRAEKFEQVKERLAGLKMVSSAQWWFILPGWIVILATGLLLASNEGFPIFHTTWLMIAFLLFVISGLIWLFGLYPVLKRLINELAVQEEKTLVYQRYSKVWNGWAIIAAILPFIILYHMFFKPY